MLSTGPCMIMGSRRSRFAHRCRPAAPAATVAAALAAAIFGAAPQSARAQNLVPNGSFESNTGIPAAYGDIHKAAPWRSPSLSSPDYLHALATSPNGVGVPANVFGNQFPVTGQAYGGFYARTQPPQYALYREYIETPLSAPLVTGQTYDVSFYVSLADQSQIAVDRIGAYLSVGPVGVVNTDYTLPFTPQINHLVGSPVTDKTGWTIVSGSFVAAGGEDTLVIGNFASNAATTPVTGQGGNNWGAYYYVDDVAVTPAAPPCIAPPPGMVAWYPLDEPNGATTVADIAPGPSSLFNNVGTAQPGPLGPPSGTTGPAPVVGQVAGAHYFWGGHFHSVAPHAELDFGTGDFSIDAWIRDVGNGQKQAVVDKLDIPGGNVGFALYFEGWLLKLNMNGTTFASTTAISHANPLGNTGPWYHVAATVARSTGAGLLYIDGVPAGPVFLPPSTSVDNALPLWIGETRLLQSPGEIAIDELELFNRALGAQEVMDLYLAGPSGKCKPNQADLGDAPDSSNHSGLLMPTYPPATNAHFPTVYDPPAPGPAGPLHNDAKGLLWLGPDVSFESDADLTPDQDPTTNLQPGNVPPTADLDLRDDGVGIVPLPDCAITQLPYGATNAASTVIQGYVNVWFDWTRDGDWDDLPKCAVAPNIDALAPEWAVQNEAVTLAPGYNAALLTSAFRSVNPSPGRATWMRITLTDAPINGANHGGPFSLPADLGKGGSGPAGGYPHGETEDYLIAGPSGRTELCVLKFDDGDGDGVQDPGDVGLAGWSFDILDAGGNVVATIVTGPGGMVCTTVPAPATYTISEIHQPGWVQTFPPPPGTHTVSAQPSQGASVQFGNHRQTTGTIFLPYAVRNAQVAPRPTPVPTAAPTDARTVVPTIPGIATTVPTPTPGGGPSATPTATSIRTATPTPSSSATSTDRPTVTATPTGGRITPTITPTSTQTPTWTPSPTRTPTATPTRGVDRPSATPTPTPGCAPPRHDGRVVAARRAGRDHRRRRRRHEPRQRAGRCGGREPSQGAFRPRVRRLERAHRRAGRRGDRPGCGRLQRGRLDPAAGRRWSAADRLQDVRTSRCAVGLALCPRRRPAVAHRQQRGQLTDGHGTDGDDGRRPVAPRGGHRPARLGHRRPTVCRRCARPHVRHDAPRRSRRHGGRALDRRRDRPGPRPAGALFRRRDRRGRGLRAGANGWGGRGDPQRGGVWEVREAGGRVAADGAGRASA